MSHAFASAGPVQVFGRRDSRDTQKALRFFRERRVAFSFVDLGARPIARAELKRFTDRFGARAVLDEDSRRYRDAGLAYMSFDEDQLFNRLLGDQQLIRLPLVRSGSDLAVGLDEKAWTTMLAD